MRLRAARSCKEAVAPRQPPPATALLRVVHLSSERTVEPVRQDSSFAEKQESHPARLLIVRRVSEPGGRVASASFAKRQRSTQRRHSGAPVELWVKFIAGGRS